MPRIKEYFISPKGSVWGRHKIRCLLDRLNVCRFKYARLSFDFADGLETVTLGPFLEGGKDKKAPTHSQAKTKEA